MTRCIFLLTSKGQVSNFTLTGSFTTQQYQLSKNLKYIRAWIFRSRSQRRCFEFTKRKHGRELAERLVADAVVGLTSNQKKFLYGDVSSDGDQTFFIPSDCDRPLGAVVCTYPLFSASIIVAVVVVRGVGGIRSRESQGETSLLPRSGLETTQTVWARRNAGAGKKRTRILLVDPRRLPTQD